MASNIRDSLLSPSHTLLSPYILHFQFQNVILALKPGADPRLWGQEKNFVPTRKNKDFMFHCIKHNTIERHTE